MDCYFWSTYHYISLRKHEKFIGMTLDICLHHFWQDYPTAQYMPIQVEAVENHMPEIVMVDEIGTEAEALACRTIAERGVQLVATAHGQLLENLIKNPTLSDLVGGIQSVTLGQNNCRMKHNNTNR